ncbi:MAG: VPDSG-CTERM sorting domain-containing protein [Verrucomicrobiales bacterium]
MKILKTLALVVTLGVTSFTASAVNYGVNYDAAPTLLSGSLALDGGWESDQIDFADTDSVNSPYSFFGPATFSITDDFIVGDTFKVYDFGSLIMTTSLTAGGQPFGGGVGGPDFQWGSVTLGAGAHQISVQGDGAGGLAAGFFVRLDSARGVPDGGSTAALFGLVLLGLVAAKNRR